jgi:hypothetical protein
MIYYGKYKVVLFNIKYIVELIYILFDIFQIAICKMKLIMIPINNFFISFIYLLTIGNNIIATT